jgi:transposase
VLAAVLMAVAVLRQLHAIITTGQAWNPQTAAGGTRHREPVLQAA